MKLGILGGTFDPVHISHIYMAQECIYLLNLDKLLVIPNGDPPHKDNKVTSSKHRLKMAQLAFLNKNKIEVSKMEIDSEEISYTYLTLSKLKNQFKNDELYFILGADSLINFPKWKNPKEILDMCVIVCFDRPGYKLSLKEEAVQKIETLGGRVILIDSLELEISSTDIRSRIKEGRPYGFFLDSKVESYIEENNLYK